jgi:hypothetical protein
MRSPIVGFNVAGVVFGLLALVQLARVIIRPEVLVQGYAMPLWPSVVAAIALGGLCFWMLELARELARKRAGMQ